MGFGILQKASCQPANGGGKRGGKPMKKVVFRPVFSCQFRPFFISFPPMEIDDIGTHDMPIPPPRNGRRPKAENHVSSPPDGKPILPAPRPKERISPARPGMLLKNEAGLSRRNPPWHVVEEAIRELDQGYGNSFACLSVPGNTYIQCLRGFNGWHLEWRITGDHPDTYVHLRACYHGLSRKPFELKKHNHISGGQHRDLLHGEDVVDAFRAFHSGEGPPVWLEWRKLDL